MKKILFVSIIVGVLAFYVGMAIQTEHPMDQLYDSAIEEINKAHVVNFKSGFVVKLYNEDEEIVDQWQMKRQGIYDVWSNYLHYKNVLKYEYDDDDVVEEDDTSLSFDPTGKTITLPIEEVYFDNEMFYSFDRDGETWSYQQKDEFHLLELLPFDAELINRYAELDKMENRGKFVVLFFSVDTDYLTKNYPNILESDSLDFPYKFNEGTIKILIFPDTMLTRRVYSKYLIENLETHEVYEYNLDTYFSENEDFPDNNPEIPNEILQYKE